MAEMLQKSLSSKVATRKIHSWYLR